MSHVHPRRLVLALAVLSLALAPGADAHIYWTGNDAIGRSNLDGTGANQSFITGAGASRGVAVDGGHVYWTNPWTDTIGRANLDGTGVDRSFITGASDPYAVAVDAGHVYWTNLGTNPSSIGRANLDGTGADQSFITGAGGFGMAVDASHVYWTSGSGDTVGRANLDGTGANRTFIRGSGEPQQRAVIPRESTLVGVAVNAGHVYWANAFTNRIGRANLDGTGVDRSFITGGGQTAGVALDAGHVYWTNYGGEAGGRANLDGAGANGNFIMGASRAFAVAVTPLETTITAGPSGTVGSSATSFSFSGSEPGGFECRLDGGSFAPCRSPQLYTGLANGSHAFSVRARDSVGNIDPTPALRVWSVAADLTPARLLAYRLSPARFRAAKRGGRVRSARAKVGTTVRYALSEPASVRFTLERAAKGRKARGKCRNPARRNSGARRCTRYVKLRGSFTRQGRQGKNRFKFTGRLGGRKLRPGRYRLVATTTDAAANKSKPRSARFRIVRR